MIDDNYTKSNDWLSDRTKTIMVTTIMIMLISGMLWGYYAAHQWQKERAEFERQYMMLPHNPTEVEE